MALEIDVAVVSADIAQALHNFWYTDYSHIRVSADGGVVLLTGTVHSPHDREIASASTWASNGVVHVENDLRVVGRNQIYP